MYLIRGSQPIGMTDEVGKNISQKNFKLKPILITLHTTSVFPYLYIISSAFSLSNCNPFFKKSKGCGCPKNNGMLDIKHKRLSPLGTF